MHRYNRIRWKRRVIGFNGLILRGRCSSELDEASAGTAVWGNRGAALNFGVKVSNGPKAEVID